MSKSPPSEVMNITNMLDKNSAVAAAAGAGQSVKLEHQPSPHPPVQGATADRNNSPHGSESSHFSGPRPATLDVLNGMSKSLPYGSPTSMQTSLPLPDPNMAPLPGMPPMNLPPSYKHTFGEHPPKAYPCSTCSKGFARRSDLARHGKSTRQGTRVIRR